MLFVSGFVVFSVLGFMAAEQGVTVDAVAKSGAVGVLFFVCASFVLVFASHLCVISISQ